MKIKLFAIAAMTAFATACASTPAEVDEPIPAPRPEPVAGPAQPAGPTAGSAAHFVANAGDRVFYGYDRHDLSAEARSTLRDQAAGAGLACVHILSTSPAEAQDIRCRALALDVCRAFARAGAHGGDVPAVISDPF